MSGDIRPRLAADPAHGDPVAIRSHHLRAALSPCLGAAPPTLASVAPDPPTFAFAPMRATAQERTAVIEAAREVLDGLVSWEIERLEDHLAPRATVLWADGGTGTYDTAALLAALDARGGRAAALLPRDYRTYAPGEWRAVLPRGYAALFGGLVPDRAGLAVTAALDGKGGAVGRALLYAAPDAEGRWRILSGPLPSPDDVVVAGAATSLDEDEAIRVADKAVRRWHLGQSDQLEAMRNNVADRIWFRGELVEAPTWARRAAEVPPDGATFTVFLGTRERLDVVSDMPRDERRTLEREARRTWRRTWDALRPRGLVTKLGEWDPEQRAVARTWEVRSFVLRFVDEDARGERRERWRLGGMWA